MKRILHARSLANLKPGQSTGRKPFEDPTDRFSIRIPKRLIEPLKAIPRADIVKALENLLR